MGMVDEYWEAVRAARRAGYVVVADPDSGTPARVEGRVMYVDGEGDTKKVVAEMLAILRTCDASSG